MAGLAPPGKRFFLTEQFPDELLAFGSLFGGRRRLLRSGRPRAVSGDLAIAGVTPAITFDSSRLSECRSVFLRMAIRFRAERSTGASNEQSNNA
jgi:hypothetical protein